MYLGHLPERVRRIGDARRLINVLADIHVCALGYSGIPQDTRTIYSILAMSEDIAVTGLLSGESSILEKSARMPRAEEAVLASRYNLARKIGAIPDEVQYGDRSFVGQIMRELGRVMNVISPAHWPGRLFRNSFGTTAIPAGEIQDFLWQRYFTYSLPTEQMETVLGTSFVISQLSLATIKTRIQLGGMNQPCLETQGYQYYFAPMPTIVKPSPGTQKIVRFHDAIPLTHPHLLSDSAAIKNYFIALRQSLRDNALFVCNSEASRDVLRDLRGNQTVDAEVIPCAIRSVPRRPASSSALKSILSSNLLQIPPKRRAEAPYPSAPLAAIAEKISATFDGNYLLTVSNIEPKKNYETLIDAWEQLRANVDPSLKLVLVAKPGWKYARILARIEPHYIRGDIVHLHAVSSVDLAQLIANAAAFIFPSVVEGFGIGAVEAARARCPTIISDIPAHRSVMKDGTLYFAPLDANALVNRVIEILYTDNAANLRATIIDKAYQVTEAYEVDNVARQWRDLLSSRFKGVS